MAWPAGGGVTAARNSGGAAHKPEVLMGENRWRRARAVQNARKMRIGRLADAGAIEFLMMQTSIQTRQDVR